MFKVRAHRYLGSSPRAAHTNELGLLGQIVKDLLRALFVRHTIISQASRLEPTASFLHAPSQKVEKFLAGVSCVMAASYATESVELQHLVSVGCTRHAESARRPRSLASLRLTFYGPAGSELRRVRMSASLLSSHSYLTIVRYQNLSHLHPARALIDAATEVCTNLPPPHRDSVAADYHQA